MTLHSLNGEFGISLGVLGVGFTSNAEITDGYFYGRLPNFIYQSEAGFGVTFSPLVFLLGINNNDYSSLTFINISLFYNFFKQTRSFLVLGPFISVNALNYNDPRFVEFHSGLTFSLRNILRDIYYPGDSVFDSDSFHIELGYRYNKNDSHGFYIHTGVDLLAVVWFLASGRERKVDEYYKERRR